MNRPKGSSSSKIVSSTPNNSVVSDDPPSSDTTANISIITTNNTNNNLASPMSAINIINEEATTAQHDQQNQVPTSAIKLVSSSALSIVSQVSGRRKSKMSQLLSISKPASGTTSNSPPSPPASSGAGSNLLSSIKSKTLSASRLLVKNASSRPGSPSHKKQQKQRSGIDLTHHIPIDLETQIVTNEKNSVIQEDDSFDNDDDDEDFDNDDDDDEQESDEEDNTDDDNDTPVKSSGQKKSKSGSSSSRKYSKKKESNQEIIVNSSLFDEDDDDDEVNVTDQVYDNEDENLDSFHRDLDEECYYSSNRKGAKSGDKTSHQTGQSGRSSLKNIFSKITSSQQPKDASSHTNASSSELVPLNKTSIKSASHQQPKRQQSSDQLPSGASSSGVLLNSSKLPSSPPSSILRNVASFQLEAGKVSIGQPQQPQQQPSQTNLNSSNRVQSSIANNTNNNITRQLVSFVDESAQNSSNLKFNKNNEQTSQQRTSAASAEKEPLLSGSDENTNNNNTDNNNFEKSALARIEFYKQESTLSAPAFTNASFRNAIFDSNQLDVANKTEFPLSTSFTSTNSCFANSYPQGATLNRPQYLNQHRSEQLLSAPNISTSKGLNKTRGSKAMRLMGNNNMGLVGNGPLKTQLSLSNGSSKGANNRNNANKKQQQKRLFFKNGNINISRCNIDKRRRRYLTDIFTTLIDLKWRYNLLVFLLGFFISWTIFAVTWYVISYFHGDLEPNLPENYTQCVNGLKGFAGAILFSIETQQTIGYGARYTTEKCPEAIFVMMIQSSVGVMIQSFMVGVVFAKLSRPKKRSETLMFSKNAVISLRDGRLCLICRVGDMRKSHIVEAHVRMYLIKKRVTQEGEILPLHMYDLNVGWDKGLDRLFLVWPLTIEHYIDENSPFWTISAEDLKKERFEIAVILEGIVESTGMTTQARSSYLVNEILWGHRFEKLITFQKEDGTYKIDYSRFDMTVPIDTPTCSAKELAELKEEEKYNFSNNYNFSSPSELYYYDHQSNASAIALNNGEMRKRRGTEKSNDEEMMSETSFSPMTPSIRINDIDGAAGGGCEIQVVVDDLSSIPNHESA